MIDLNQVSTWVLREFVFNSFDKFLEFVTPLINLHEALFESTGVVRLQTMW